MFRSAGPPTPSMRAESLFCHIHQLSGRRGVTDAPHPQPATEVGTQRVRRLGVGVDVDDHAATGARLDGLDERPDLSEQVGPAGPAVGGQLDVHSGREGVGRSGAGQRGRVVIALGGARAAQPEVVVPADLQAGPGRVPPAGAERRVDVRPALGRLEVGEGDPGPVHARPVDARLVVGGVDALDPPGPLRRGTRGQRRSRGRRRGGDRRSRRRRTRGPRRRLGPAAGQEQEQQHGQGGLPHRWGSRPPSGTMPFSKA